MLSRLFWSITTPRQIRRSTLIVLLIWTAAAFLHHSGIADTAPELKHPQWAGDSGGWAR